MFLFASAESYGFTSYDRTGQSGLPYGTGTQNRLIRNSYDMIIALGFSFSAFVFGWRVAAARGGSRMGHGCWEPYNVHGTRLSAVLSY